MIPVLALPLVAALGLDPAALHLASDWVRERPPPYPNLIASFRHRDGAILTLGRQYLAAGEDGETFARGNARALERMGIVARREGSRVRAASRDGGIEVRQAYVVKGTVGWVLTLAGSPAAVLGLRRDFAAVLAQIER